jgi:PAS domain S-box-containing protein
MNNPLNQRDYPLILIVDDDEFMRLQLRQALEQVGYQLIEASNGEEALTAYTDYNPDIVLLDALMPVMDGFTCCKLLRKLPGGEYTPVLIVTALEARKSLDQAFEVGASDCITKPIPWTVLRQRIHRLLLAKRATEELRQQTERAILSEERLRLALEAARMGTWDWDIERGKVAHSVTTEALHGVAPGAFDGTVNGFFNSLHPDDREMVREALRRTLEEGADYNIEFRVLWPDGSIHWIASKGQVYYNNSGKPVRMTGINMDITERKQVEEALRVSEELWQLAWRGSNDGLWDWNIKNNKAFLSTRWKEMLGYEDCEISNHLDEWVKRVHPDDLGWVMQAVQDHLAKKTPFYSAEHRILCKDGTYKWILARGQAIWDQEGKPMRMTGSHTDMTQRKQAEEELQRQNLRSQLFAEVTLKIRQSLQIEEILHTSVTEVQRILKSDRVLLFQLLSNGLGKVVTEAVNPNYPSVLGKNITEKCLETDYLHKYSHGRIYAIDDIDKAEVPECLVEFMQEFNVKAKLSVPIFLKEKFWGLLIAHQCNQPRVWSSFETELLGQLADQIGIALAQAQLLEQETRYCQELARSNAELQQFASIASHDLQEPLRKIQAFGDRLKNKYSEVLTEQGRDYLERMQNAASRMQNLIDALLLLSRITTRAQPFVAVNLGEVVQEVLLDLEVRIDSEQARIELGSLPTIEADRLQMRQLLQNLIGNGLKFHAKDEPPQVKIWARLTDSQNINDQLAKINEEIPFLYNPTHCQIVVQDHGIGFDEKYTDRIFNVFQRLQGRSEYEGTGMGLAICRKIVERHNGSITAKSTPGQGATFIVTLPIKQRQGENSQ